MGKTTLDYLSEVEVTLVSVYRNSYTLMNVLKTKNT